MTFIEYFAKTAFNHIYLLQRENYDLARFYRAVAPTLFTRPFDRSARTVWTNKLAAIAAIAIILEFVLAYMVAWVFSSFIPVANPVIMPLIILAVFFLSLLVFFIFLIAASAIVWPLDYALKGYEIALARRIVRDNPQMEVIGIAGSYGKTTMKELVASVLGETLSVVKTPENKNTPLALARLIRSQVSKDTQVLVVEMGEYVRGDVRALSTLVAPSIGIVTGINSAHLERFKTIDATIETIFEIADGARSNARFLVNGDDENAAKNYERFLPEERTFVYSSNGENKEFRVEDASFTLEGTTVELIHNGKRHSVRTALVGEHIIGSIIAALKVADIVGVPLESAIEGIGKLSAIDGRLQRLPGRNGVLVVNDAYNANPASAHAGLAALSRIAPDKDYVIVLGDMLELGSESATAHTVLGRKAAQADPALLVVVGSQAPRLAEGAREEHFPEERILAFEDVDKLLAAEIPFQEFGDLVYLKASNGIGLSRLADTLVERRQGEREE